jgi:hypothetical protein
VAVARRDLAAASVLFVVSGAAALVYQVAWQRLLALTTGVGVYSVAIITAAFMAGLGLGSHAGGVISARLTARRALAAFGLIELGVAAFAAVSVPLYYGVLYQRASALYDGLGRATVTHLLSLLPPTVLMGMSLPFLVRGLVRARAGAARTIGYLYGANALGAALGAFLTPWVLLRFLGVTGAVQAAAAGSALAGLGALLIARGALSAAAPGPSPDAPPAAEPPQPFRVWLLLYALSGFVALSLEMAWFRVLDVAAKGAAFTFGTLLAGYLVGLAAGTLAAARRAEALRRPLAVFLACQAGVVLSTLAAHAALAWLPAAWPGVEWLVAYGHRQYGVKMAPFEGWAFAGVYVLLPLVLFGPATFLMGFGFPVLQRATQSDPATSGRRVGILQAGNIAGCALGSLVTGLLLFDAVGTSGVFRMLAGVAAAVALVGARALRDRRFAGAAAALLLLAAAFPGNDRLWRRLHGAPPPEDSFVEENAASVTALTPQPGGYRLAVNGRHNSWLPFGWLHTIIGAMPAVAHPAPAEVAVIGLGSGDTAWAAGCRDTTRRVTVFEIASSQPRLLARVAGQPTMSRLHDFLRDPRVTIVGDDGRRRLQADGRTYDLIVNDSIDFDTSMVTHLQSVEYYRLVRSRLRPGGLFCALARTPRLRAAVQRVFPHTVYFREDLLLAGAEPIVIDREGWTARLRSPHVVEYLGRARMREVVAFVERAHYGRPLPPDADVNRDLEPKDEFFRP